VTKQQKLIAFIALLALANLWRMLAADDPVEHPHSPARGVVAADLVLNPAFTEGESVGPMRRNVFQPKARDEKPAAGPKPAASRTEAPTSPVQTEQDAARAELSKIKLLGVLVRDGKAQAYLANGPDTYLAFEGDTVADRYVVESVAVDSVELNDSKFNVRGRIPISGR